MRLAIITARGGSKRIPRKNIKNFCGMPIIAYSIKAAIASNCFDEVMVSTDDTEIATVAEQYGAKVPFIRSKKNSDDFATTADVIVEVLEHYKANGVTPDIACCIYPTAPFITPEILRESLDLLLESNDIEGVIPVARFSYPIQRALMIADGKVSMFNPEHLQTRSQDLEPAYHDAGQFYWVRTDSFITSKNLMSKNTKGFVIPETNVQDIDTLDDWEIAEIKYKILHRENTVIFND